MQGGDTKTVLRTEGRKLPISNINESTLDLGRGGGGGGRTWKQRDTVLWRSFLISDINESTLDLYELYKL